MSGLDESAVERAEMALTMFVFPGVVVPRREMAEAVCRALSHNEDPRIGIAKMVVRMPKACYRDDDRATYACSRCNGTGKVQQLGSDPEDPS
ncbi:MAG TPA: hypothetical protein VN213_20175 [Solirubrobacteraceae bacterium]|nr:hypothetical protein [Solirubrobacteraceae bacterium]